MESSHKNHFAHCIEQGIKKSENNSAHTGYAFRYFEGENFTDLTYQALDKKAHALANHLQSQVSVGDRAILLFKPGVDFIYAITACFYAGIVAVPLPFPTQQTVQRIVNTINDCSPKIVLTTAEDSESVKSMLSEQLNHSDNISHLLWLQSDDNFISNNAFSPYSHNPEDIAFLQYTSGSTSQPKGVMVSYENLQHNASVIAEGFACEKNYPFGASWLPHYHDMGLIGGILQVLYHGSSSVLMSPLAFARNPFQWLKLISDNQVVIGGGPNFAYEYCVQRIPKKLVNELDLSSWQVAFCGAEPIRVKTLERFAEHFSPAGFSASAFTTCYGLAENTLAASIKRHEKKIQSIEVLTTELSQGRIVQKNETGKIPDKAINNDSEINTLTLCSCGTPYDQSIVIVDPHSHKQCAEKSVGEIWINNTTGKSVARGYWNNKLATQEVFNATLFSESSEASSINSSEHSETFTKFKNSNTNTKPQNTYFKTGDLGAWVDGELYITGRIKEAIILNGVNLAPQDIEACIVDEIPELVWDYVVACAFTNKDASGNIREKLAVLIHANETIQADLAIAVQKSLWQHFNITAELFFIPKKLFKRTSSGKKMRVEAGLSISSNQFDQYRFSG